MKRRNRVITQKKVKSEKKNYENQENKEFRLKVQISQNNDLLVLLYLSSYIIDYFYLSNVVSP